MTKTVNRLRLKLIARSPWFGQSHPTTYNTKRLFKVRFKAIFSRILTSNAPQIAYKLSLVRDFLTTSSHVAATDTNIYDNTACGKSSYANTKQPEKKLNITYHDTTRRFRRGGEGANMSEREFMQIIHYRDICKTMALSPHYIHSGSQKRTSSSSSSTK